MNKIFSLCIGAAAISALASCSTTKTATNISELNGEWAIAAIDGKPVTSPADQETAYLGFNTATGEIYGNASCNAIMGSFDTNAAPGTIDLSNLGSTRMMCPDMSLEDALFQALPRVKGYELNKNGEIGLTDADGKDVVLLRRRDPSITAADLHGEWNVKEINGEKTDSLPGAPFVFTFDGDSFSCSTDCNGLMGSYTVSGKAMNFGNVASTRMACPDPKVEQAITTILPKVASVGKLAGGGIGLYDAENNMLLLLEQ